MKRILMRKGCGTSIEQNLVGDQETIEIILELRGRSRRVPKLNGENDEHGRTQENDN